MRFDHHVVVASALFLSLTGAVPARHLSAAASGTCGLITQQEAATAVGAAVPAGVEKSMNFPVEGVVIKSQACLFGSAVVAARYELGRDASTLFAKYRQSFASQAASVDYQDVKGIGDEAFTAKGQLHILKGQTGLLVGVSLGDGQNVRIAARALQAEKALAALALGRL